MMMLMTKLLLHSRFVIGLQLTKLRAGNSTTDEL